MESIKEKIESLIENNLYKTMRFKEIAKVTGVKGKEMEMQLEKVLAILQEEGILYRNEKRDFALVKDSGYVLGTFGANQRGFGFVAVEGSDDDIFVFKDNTNFAMNGDTVLVQIIKEKETDTDKKSEGKVISIVKRAKDVIIGKLELSKNFGFVVPDDMKLLYDIYIPKEGLNGAKNNQKVIAKILRWPDKDKKASGVILEVLGDEGDPKLDFVSVLRMYNIKEEFSEDTISEVKNMQLDINEKELARRKDLRNELVMTIDSADTKDIDDAISLKKISDNVYELGVHIADVSHYVQEGTSLNDEAIERATSVYLINKVVPMLPQKLSNGLCSLNEGEDRFAVSCIMKINKSGDVIDNEICKSIIHSGKKGVYSEINDIIDKKVDAKYLEYEKFLSTIETMTELQKILWAKREKRGSIEFDLYESKIILDDNDVAIGIAKKDRGLSEKIIEEFMLAANETVAEVFNKMNMPFIYRIHEEPDPEKLYTLIKVLNNLNIKFTLNKEDIKPKDIQKILLDVKDDSHSKTIGMLTLRSMQQAKYSSENKGHFGLANEYYCHFTSPIRRYPDLFVHRMITKAIENKYNITEKIKKAYEHQAEEYAYISSVQERNAVDAEREFDDIKKCEYMQDKVGEIYDGIISTLTGFGMFVELDNTIEGLVRYEDMQDDYYQFNEEMMCTIGERTNSKFVVGDSIKVKLINVDKKLRRIDFEIVKDE